MAKKIFRRSVGTLLILLAILVLRLPMGLDASKTNTQSDFLMDNDILVKYTGTAETVSVPDSVKEIGEEAFSGNSVLKKITLPKNLEKISYGAFYECSSLEKIAIPDKCNTIETAAFGNCVSLKEVSMGANLKSLGNGVFVGCSSLKKISSASPDYICTNSAIYNKDKTKLIEVLPTLKSDNFKIASSTKTIMPYAFYGCNKIKSVTLPTDIAEIPSYSFSNCNGLKNISLPYSVLNIDAKAFENCSNLTNVFIPESVSYIHSTAFDGCPKLSVDAPTGCYAYNWFKQFDNSDVAITDSEDNDNDVISDDSDEENKEDKENTSDNKQPSENKDGKQLFEIHTVSGNNIGQTRVVGRNAVFFIDNTEAPVSEENITGSEASLPLDNPDFSDFDFIPEDNNLKGSLLFKLSIVDNKIAGKAFYGDTSLTSYEIPENITSIGDFSFARTGLETIVIPDGVTSIGYGAFYHCDNLKNIVVPSSVTRIEASAFDMTRMMDNFKKYGSSDFMILGDGILVAYKGKESSVHIPDGVKQIGANCFENNKSVSEVYLPDSIVSIGEDAFNGCSSLKYLSGGMNLKTIEDRAFMNCPLETVRIVESVENIGLRAFDYSDSDISENKKVAYFYGDDLPKIYYGKLSSRLTNEDYRKDALSDVKIAVVSNENINLKGTVLDKDLSGFSGIICVTAVKNSGLSNGTLKIIGNTLSYEEALDFSVPDTVLVFGKEYDLSQDELSVSLNEVLSNHIDETSEAQNSESEETDTINMDEYVSFGGSDDLYKIEIAYDEHPSEEISRAYYRAFSQSVPSNVISFDINVHKKDSDIYLSKFGKQMLKVSTDVPSIATQGKLHLVCLDDDGQLEEVKYVNVNDESGNKLEFSVNHTGKFAFYSIKSESDGMNMDDSPDTGDHSIEPKLFLAIGLFLAGIAMFLIKGKKKYIV